MPSCCRERGHEGLSPCSPSPAAPQAPPTSAWPPEVSVFPHFSHFRQGRCQSFPRDVTLSAAEVHKAPHETLLCRHRAHPPTHIPTFSSHPCPGPRPPTPGGPPEVSDSPCAPWVLSSTSGAPGQSSQINGEALRRGQGVGRSGGPSSRVKPSDLCTDHGVGPAGRLLRGPGWGTSHFFLPLPWVGPRTQDTEVEPRT